MFRWLVLGFLAGLWLSLEAAQMENPNMCEYPTSFCYNTDSNKACFTTFHMSHRAMCNSIFSDSTVVLIKSIQGQISVEIMTARHIFANGTIVMDPQMFAANVSFKWPLFNNHQAMQKDTKQHNGDEEGRSSVDPNVGQSRPFCVGHVKSPHRYTCHYSADTRSPHCDSSYTQCVCTENDKEGEEEYDGKRWCCNCDHSCTIVCHETTTTYDSTIAADGNDDPTSSTTQKLSNTDTPSNNEKQSTADKPTITEKQSNSEKPSITQKSSNYSFSVGQPNAIPPASSSPSAGQVNSSDPYIYTFLLIILFVVVAFIIVAVVLFIRKRKSDKRNEWSPVAYTSQGETVPNVYAGVFPDNRPSEGPAPAGNHIYDELDTMTQDPTPSNVYSEVQSASVAVDMGRSVDYVDIDLPIKDQQKPMSTSKVPLSLSPVYSQPFEPSANNTEYAEPFKPDTIDTATAPVLSYSSAAGEQPNDVYSLAKAIPLSDPNVIYSQPNKPAKSSEPAGEVHVGGATNPIHSEAIGVKPGVGAGGVVTQDPNAVYAEPMKPKKSS